MNRIFWRYKGDRTWRESIAENLGNGLIKIFNNSFNDREYNIYSLDEIETKDAVK
jgi:hypothetical protein